MGNYRFEAKLDVAVIDAGGLFHHACSIDMPTSEHCLYQRYMFPQNSSRLTKSPFLESWQLGENALRK